MKVQERSLLSIAILNLITFGIYSIYWAVKTKNELNQLGASLPTGWLVVIPLANFYFWFRYSEAYVNIIKHGHGDELIYFAFSLLFVVPPFAMFSAFIPMMIFQTGLNKFAKD